MLADGDALCDVRALRDEPSLFGPVASDATAWRAIAAVDAERLDAIRRARAQARAQVWDVAGAPRRVILDIDATLVTAHSDKQGAAGTFKGGYGCSPLVCFEAETREAMSALLRPGNAGANNGWDHIEVLCLALEQLPAEIDPRSVLLRCDSAGATHLLTSTASELELRFTVGFDLTEPVRAAILRLPESAWQPALGADDEPREGAGVAELADLDLSAWPAGTRAICRRERPHPGAQLSFSDHDGHRFQVFITNQTGARIARLEQLHRQRASVEDAIRCAKDSGLRNRAIPRPRAQRCLARARAHGPRRDRLDTTALAQPGPSASLGAQTAPLPHPARRRAHHPTRPPHPLAPPKRLALAPRADHRLAATQRPPRYVALAQADRERRPSPARHRTPRASRQ
jgi:hypothetical protein